MELGDERNGGSAYVRVGVGSVQAGKEGVARGPASVHAGLRVRVRGETQGWSLSLSAVTCCWAKACMSLMVPRMLCGTARPWVSYRNEGNSLASAVAAEAMAVQRESQQRLFAQGERG
jgi:hypothetical protein